MTTGGVLSLGEVLIDIIVADGAPSLLEAGAFVARPGGAPANVAVALSRMGIPSGFCGVVGDDPFGERLRRVLQAEGVATDTLHVTDEVDTTIAFAWKNERGDGHFRILRLADTRLSPEHVAAARIEDRTAIIVGSVALAVSPAREAIYDAVERAKSAGVPVVFDINMRPSIWRSLGDAREACRPVLERTTLLKLSVDDARSLFELEEPEAILGADLGEATGVLLTDGARGAWFRAAGGEVIHVPAFPIVAVEPTGAGDAFLAGALCRLIETGWAPLTRDDLRFAAAAGAITATRVGAMESLPHRNEIEAFLGSVG